METVKSPRLPRMRYNLPDLARLARKIAPAGLLVEVGSFAGESTNVFLQAGLHVHAIDPWDNASRDRLNEGCLRYNADHHWAFDMNEAEQRFDRLLEQYPKRLTKRKGYDWQFTELYPEACLDAVYIDSVHTYGEVRAAISRWRPKIKPGGHLCGHDYADGFPGVVQAVDELCNQPDLVLGDTSWLVFIHGLSI